MTFGKIDVRQNIYFWSQWSVKEYMKKQNQFYYIIGFQRKFAKNILSLEEGKRNRMIGKFLDVDRLSNRKGPFNFMSLNKP